MVVQGVSITVTFNLTVLWRERVYVYENSVKVTNKD